MNKNYVKWFMEICNQEYKGSIRILESDIKNIGVIE